MRAWIRFGSKLQRLAPLLARTTMIDFPTLQQIIRDPVVQTGLLAAVGAAITHIALKKRPAHRLIGQVILFAALTALLLSHGIVPYEAGPPEASLLQRVFIGLAKVIWWTNAALSLAGFVRVYLIFEGQPREGRLIQDLIVGLIYVGAILSVVSNVFSFPVGTVIATSGVFAIIVGLAMQNTLSDVFSGIALNIGRPLAVGDWISLGNGIEGRVLETNWRATHLLSDSHDLVVLPNSMLAKATLTNLSGPDRRHGAAITVRILPTAPPTTIVNVMREVLMSCNSILATPAPAVHVKALDAHAVEIELSFKIADLSSTGATKDEIYDLIYRHTKAAGLKLSLPADQQDIFVPQPSGAPASPHRPTPLRLLDAVPLFSCLTEDEKEALAATMSRRTYRKDEVVVEQGTVMTALMIVRNGVLAVTSKDGSRPIEMNRLAPGDFFGEDGLLTGSGEPGTIRALTFVVVYEIDKAGLAPLLHDRPGIADELGAVLTHRAHAKSKLLTHAPEPQDHGSVARLAARIRSYIHRQHTDA